MLEILKRNKDYVSNSWLATIKRELLGQPAFYGGEKFLAFGGEMHRRFLEPKTIMELATMKYWEDEDEVRVNNMVARLWQVPLLKEAWKRSQKEIEYWRVIYGILCMGVLDMKYNKIGIDLKSTWVKTRVSFIEAAKRYDYFRQAVLYKKLANLDSFIIVAICKDPPHDVFELHCNDYPEEMAKGEKELEFLINLHKRYVNN